MPNLKIELVLLADIQAFIAQDINTTYGVKLVAEVQIIVKEGVQSLFAQR